MLIIGSAAPEGMPSHWVWNLLFSVSFFITMATHTHTHACTNFCPIYSKCHVNTRICMLMRLKLCCKKNDYENKVYSHSARNIWFSCLFYFDMLFSFVCIFSFLITVMLCFTYFILSLRACNVWRVWRRKSIRREIGFCVATRVPAASFIYHFLARACFGWLMVGWVVL